MARVRCWAGVLLAGGLAGAGPAVAGGWHLALQGGGVRNADADLRIKQDGHEDIVLKDTPLDSHPFGESPYYALRLGHWRAGRAWEVEHVHQKLYVADGHLPPSVQNFEISDGYNLFFVNRAWHWPGAGLDLRLGAGPVVVHPDIRVRGESNHVRGGGAVPLVFSRGYHWSGAAVQAGLGKRIPLGGHWYGLLEARATHAWADVPIQGGRVVVKNSALHGNFGLAYAF